MAAVDIEAEVEERAVREDDDMVDAVGGVDDVTGVFEGFAAMEEVTVGDWPEIDFEFFFLRTDFAFACPETTLEFMSKFSRFFLNSFSLF